MVQFGGPVGTKRTSASLTEPHPRFFVWIAGYPATTSWRSIICSFSPTIVEAVSSKGNRFGFLRKVPDPPACALANEEGVLRSQPRDRCPPCGWRWQSRPWRASPLSSGSVLLTDAVLALSTFRSAFPLFICPPGHITAPAVLCQDGHTMSIRGQFRKGPYGREKACRVRDIGWAHTHAPFRIRPE